MKKIDFINLNTASLGAQLEAIKEYACSIRLIKNPSLEVQREAVKKNYFSVLYIKEPCLDALLLAYLGCIKDDDYTKERILEKMKEFINKKKETC
jgi:hypothetical protein